MCRLRRLTKVTMIKLSGSLLLSQHSNTAFPIHLLLHLAGFRSPSMHSTTMSPAGTRLAAMEDSNGSFTCPTPATITRARSPIPVSLRSPRDCYVSPAIQLITLGQIRSTIGWTEWLSLTTFTTSSMARMTPSTAVELITTRYADSIRSAVWLLTPIVVLQHRCYALW